jgi:hypothetical protein
VRKTLVLASIFVSCSSAPDENRYGQPSTEVLFSPTITHVTIEVDYARGAEPYTGPLGTFDDVWQLFQANAARVFMRSPKTLEMPSTLSAMEAIDVGGTTFTTAQILAIADAHRTIKNTATSASFYVVWLPGTLKQEGKSSREVLGV